MTREELRQYIEERLLAYDPLIDLTNGGDAYSQVVAPILDKLSQDVLDMDVAEFIKDRLWQEYRIGVTDGDGISDLFIKPHALVLEPFKRSINALKANQSLRYPELLADDEADALAGNWFANRNEGSYSSGSVRVYFAVPSAQTVSPNTRFFTDSGLNFFPNITQSITADQMLFQRDGSEYYMDVTVRAENPGPDYAIVPGEIKGAEGLGNSIRATNLRQFSVALQRETTPNFAARVGESLTERTLTSSRGNRARILETFTDVVSLELVGYGDAEMQRDILKGEGDGLLYASGRALAIKQYVLVFSNFEDRGDGTRRPEVGDPFVLNYNAPFFLETSQQRPWEQRTERFRIANILFSSLDAGFVGWPGTFLIELDRLPMVNEMTWLPLAKETIIANFALYKPGMITISDMPGGIQVPNTAEGTLQIRTDEVHVGGHYDAYIRPSASSTDSLVLENVTDNLPLLAGTYLQTFTAPTANVVQGNVDWRRMGVEPGHTLVIESGLDAGEYTIMGVGVDITSDELYLGQDLTGGAAVNLRFRILDELNIDLVNPRNQVFPSGGATPSDLTTVAGSKEVILSTFDLSDYGVEVGNVLRIEEGADAGEYLIEDLTNGKKPILGVEMTTDGVSLHYSIYASQTGIQMPLVRIKSVEVLNSDGEPSGLIVPYSEPVMAANRCCFTGSEHRCDSPYGFVAPDLRVFKPTDFGSGCPEPATLVEDMVDKDPYTVNQTWYTLAGACAAPGDEDCIPPLPLAYLGDSMELWAHNHWAAMFGNADGFDWVAAQIGGSGSNDPLGDTRWNAIDWANATTHDVNGAVVTAPDQAAIVPTHVSLLRILPELALGGFSIMRSNETLDDNPELIETGGLPWAWVVKDDTTYEMAGGDLDPFRVRRYYSDGALECDGYLICICVDYNTQFEVCLPKALFDECNNVFVSLPEFGLTSMLDNLEQSIREYTPSYGPLREEEVIPFDKIIKDLFKPACLCDAKPGDVVTLERGPNAGSYIVEEVHKIRLDLSLMLDEGEQTRFAEYLQFLFTEEDLGGFVAVPIPLDICLVKIEGQFPSGMLQWFNKLFSEDGITLQDMFGDGYTRLVDFAVKVLGLNETTGRASIENWWDLNKTVDLREFLGLSDLLPIPLTTQWGCDADVTKLSQGLLGLLSPTTAWDKWEDWDANLVALSSGVSRPVLSLLMVLMRRVDAYGLGGLMEFFLPPEPTYRVEEITDVEPPDPDVGDLYAIRTAWTGAINDIVECTGTSPSTWGTPVPPTDQETMWERAGAAYYVYDASAIPAWKWDQEEATFLAKLSDELMAAGWNRDALIYGGGLPLEPFYWFIEAIGDMAAGMTAEFGESNFILSSILALLDRGIYLLLTLPVQLIWGYATEDNPDMIPQNMVIDVPELISKISQMIFTPYSSGSSICDNHIRVYFIEPTTVEFDAGLNNCSLQWERTVPSYFATRVGETELLYSASSQVTPREIVPFRETEPIADVDLPRGIEMKEITYPPNWDDRNQWRFTDESLGAPITHGVLPGKDYLELFEQRFLCPAPEIAQHYILDKDRQFGPATGNADGDTYIVSALGSLGNWAAVGAAADDIVQYDANISDWVVIKTALLLVDGETAQVADEGRLYVWDLVGTAWVVGQCSPAHKDVVPGLISARDSSIVSIPSAAIYGWNRNQIGEMIFIEKGDDAGGYTIIDVLDGKRARLDRPLTHTTESILRGGFQATFDFTGGSPSPFTIPVAASPSDPVFSGDDVGRYITVYSCYFPDCNGSYEIASYVSPTQVTLDTSGWSGTGCPLPGSSLAVNGNGQWAITDAPVDSPEFYSNDDVGDRETVATVPFRQYHKTPRAFPIGAVNPSLDIALAYITVSSIDGSPRDGLHQPFRIVRPGIQRFSSTEMVENQEQGLYYVDVLVKSLGAGSVYNLPENSRFWPVFGSYKSDGYRYIVGDTNYAFSPDEQVGLIIGPQVLPVGNEDRASFLRSLAGQTLQINYEHAPTVMGVHQFINSRADRPLCANPIARSFLPAYPYIFLTYRGGSDPESLAEEVQTLISNLGPLDAIQIDNVEAIVKRSGADYIEHPITLRAAILDLRRRWVVIESFDYLHSNAENPEFLGSDRLTYFIAPDDTSREVETPPGPQVRLIKSPAGPRVR